MISDLNKVGGLWMFGGTAIFMAGKELLFSPLEYIGVGVTALALICFIIPSHKEENEK